MKPVIGLDFGTTNSAIAVADGNRHYVSLGKELPVPVWVYSQLSSWHHMFLLRDPKTLGILREVKKQASEPDKVAALIQMISENLGYALYRAVEHTKVELTEHELGASRFCSRQFIWRIRSSAGS